MVIQRGLPFPVRGTAAANKTITVTYNSQTNSTTSDALGNWQVTLPAMSAKPNGQQLHHHRSRRQHAHLGQRGGRRCVAVQRAIQHGVRLAPIGCNPGPADISSANFPGIRCFIRCRWPPRPPTNSLTGKLVGVQSQHRRQLLGGRLLFRPGRFIRTRTAISRLGWWFRRWAAPALTPGWRPKGHRHSRAGAAVQPGHPAVWPVRPLQRHDLSFGAPSDEGRDLVSGRERGNHQPVRRQLLSEGERPDHRLEAAAGVERLRFLCGADCRLWDPAGERRAGPVLRGMGSDTRLQRGQWLNLPHAGVASAIDIGNPANMHPTNKRDVGERLALWAMKNEYGQTNLVTSGPVLSGVTVSSNVAICTFNYAGSGLMVGYKAPYESGRPSRPTLRWPCSPSPGRTETGIGRPQRSPAATRFN